MNLYGVGLGMIIFGIVGLALLFIRYTEYVFRRQKQQRMKRYQAIEQTKQQMENVLANLERQPEPHKTGLSAGLLYMALEEKLNRLQRGLDE